jgi:hypothetical protein
MIVIVVVLRLTNLSRSRSRCCVEYEAGRCRFGVGGFVASIQLVCMFIFISKSMLAVAQSVAFVHQQIHQGWRALC